RAGPASACGAGPARVPVPRSAPGHRGASAVRSSGGPLDHRKLTTRRRFGGFRSCPTARLWDTITPTVAPLLRLDPRLSFVDGSIMVVHFARSVDDIVPPDQSPSR